MKIGVTILSLMTTIWTSSAFAISDETVKELQTLKESTQKMYENGVISQASVLETQAALSEAKFQKVNRDGQLRMCEKVIADFKAAYEMEKAQFNAGASSVNPLLDTLRRLGTIESRCYDLKNPVRPL